MLDTGLRVGETLSLRPEHINFDEGRLMVREGKGAKDRVLWFGDSTREELLEWAERRPEDSPWFFPTKKGTKTASSSLRRAVKAAVRDARIPEAESVSPHTFRHTFATDLYQKTKDIELVRQALGHESIETTMIYTHLVNDDVKNGMKALRQ
jgi:integrase